VRVHRRPDMDHTPNTRERPAEVARIEQIADEGLRCARAEELLDICGDVKRPDVVAAAS